MIDRYSITPNSVELTLVLGLDVPSTYEPQFNAAPTKSLPVVTSKEPNRFTYLQWGLMTVWSNNRAMSPKFFNLPLDSVLNKSTYRKKIKTQRCVVPMDGFFVWKKVAKKKSIPYYIFFSDHRLFYAAGIWEENEEGNSFIMITRPSNESVSPFQEDMPAIIESLTAKKWLLAEDLSDLEQPLLKNLDHKLHSHTVSPIIMNLNINNEKMILHAPASDQYGNYTLFT